MFYTVLLYLKIFYLRVKNFMQDCFEKKDKKCISLIFDLKKIDL